MRAANGLAVQRRRRAGGAARRSARRGERLRLPRASPRIDGVGDGSSAQHFCPNSSLLSAASEVLRRFLEGRARDARGEGKRMWGGSSRASPAGTQRGGPHFVRPTLRRCESARAECAESWVLPPHPRPLSREGRGETSQAVADGAGDPARGACRQSGNVLLPAGNCA